MKTLLAKLLGSPSYPPVAKELVFHPSQKCPECGTSLATASGAEAWHCPNLDCPARVRERIAHWCSPEAMDVPGVDAALVAKLVGQGLALDVAEFYRIKLKELAAVEGMNPESAKKVFDALTESLKRDAWQVLFGLAIPLVAASEAKALGRGFTSVDAVFAAGVPRLVKDAGVSQSVAESVVRWYSDAVNRRLVKRLEKAGMNFKSALYQPTPER